MNKKHIAHLKKSDPVLKTVIEGITLREITNTRGRFEALVESITSQQLSVKASDTIFRRFAALVPGKKFPTPNDILKMPARKIRSVGLSRMKVSFVKDLAKKVLDKTVDLKKLDTWSDQEVIEHLTAVKGIGQWTAEMFLIFSLGREDIFSYGDLGLRNAMQKLYKLRKHPTERQAMKIAELWKPYRSLASRYLWASLDNRAKNESRKKD
ncbi:MAG TPA: DNA-3-methyladenine glycosylase [Candidatus Paceibacterota bacterium]|nr:DNA-3-methyladenine glycosylase [Candidatus Paceibacterota bacterium]